MRLRCYNENENKPKEVSPMWQYAIPVATDDKIYSSAANAANYSGTLR